MNLEKEGPGAKS